MHEKVLVQRRERPFPYRALVGAAEPGHDPFREYQKSKVERESFGG